ncbi:hypothetical protein ACFST9_14050 [Hymenobacter monticola]|uniref:Uncharacterized protein n=2 Tax=Hymenobacter TaxID=89966 RepID=A0ABY4BBQ2_9BACT|nr:MULTISPECIES: hypothetical protein [Hymenobacter]MDU0372311.1 hypothetical protein [Hymenobacter endophyticus]UOE36589.1 hypothetical protein MTP16_24165 [Hymenobacter monticola]
MNLYIEAEYEAASWELEQLLDQWPQQTERTLTLLAAIEEFSRQGACHWPAPLPPRLPEGPIDEARRARAWAHRVNPALARQYLLNLALAKEALAVRENQSQNG